MNTSARSAFQSEKPQIVWGDPSDSSRSYDRGSQRARCGFSGETPRDGPLRGLRFVWTRLFGTTKPRSPKPSRSLPQGRRRARAEVFRGSLNPAAERETLMALERKWSDMYGRGDVEGIAALLAEDSVLLTPGQSPVVGRENVIEATRALLAADAADGLSVSWEPQAAVISSSGDMAYDYGRATTTLADGTVVEGSYLVVWTREDGEWKVAADIFN